MGVHSVYCIYCRKHFTGRYLHEAAKHHMQMVHGKQVRTGNSQGCNIRYTRIPLTVLDGSRFSLIDFDGTIVVANTWPPDGNNDAVE